MPRLGSAAIIAISSCLESTTCALSNGLVCQRLSLPEVEFATPLATVLSESEVGGVEGCALWAHPGILIMFYNGPGFASTHHTPARGFALAIYLH